MAITQNITSTTATIADGDTESEAVALGGSTLLGVITPAAIDGTSLQFEVSADNSTFAPLYDSTNTREGLTISASRAYYLDPAICAAWPYIKLVATQSTADRVYTLLVRPV